MALYKRVTYNRNNMVVRSNIERITPYKSFWEASRRLDKRDGIKERIYSKLLKTKNGYDLIVTRCVATFPDGVKVVTTLERL